MLCAAPLAEARAPIMPLSQVKRGMDCEGRSVIRGVAISTFDVEILDVVEGEEPAGPRILVRVSGPAVDSTGIGPGFSGSPIYCPGSGGTLRNAGALSEGVGDYGNDVALATPIEQILGESSDPPPNSPPAPRNTRPLAGPLTFSGLSRPIRRVVFRAARRAGQAVLAAPGSPVGRYPPQSLRPGSATAVSISTGDISLSAIGTVAFRDGNDIWSFGHPLEGVGRRSLFMQDAYVYGVIENPIGAEEISTYKLAAPGHVVGSYINDAPAALVGRLASVTPRLAMRVYSRDLDTKRLQRTKLEIADETALGPPTGESGLSIVGPVAVAQSATSALRSSPALLWAKMCARIKVREYPRSFRFCNRYSSGPETAAPDVVQDMAATDFLTAVETVDGFDDPLHVTNADVKIKLARGSRLARLLGARLPSRVRAGQRVRVKLELKRVRGRRRTASFRLKIPRSLEPGEHELTLAGAGEGNDEEGDFEDVLSGLLGESGGEQEGGGSEDGPSTLEELDAEVASLARFDGVLARFDADEEESERPSGAAVYRHPKFLITGSVSGPVTVVGPKKKRKR